MKFLILSILLCGNYCFAQIYPWAAIDAPSSYGKSIARDLAGNLLVSEKYSSGLYILKYDTAYNLIWKKRLSATNGIDIDHGLAGELSTDASGNVYFTSTFGGALSVDSIVCASANGGNMFLVKFNAQGVFQWVKHSTGSSAWGRKLSCDNQNNVYVAGNINGDVYFDSIYVSSPVVYNYIAKYNPSGKLLWLKYGSDYSFSGFGIGIKTDAANNTYLTGTFLGGTVRFDSLYLTAYGSWAYEDIYIAKIDSAGKWIWVTHAGGIWQDGLYDLNLDTQGNLYITGFIGSDTAWFDNITLINTGEDDYFLAKYDSSGNAIWAINGGGPGSQFGTVVCADNQGNVYNTNNRFITKYDSNGTFQWYQAKYATNCDMVAGDSGEIYITGHFNGTVNFGNYSFSSSGNRFFVAKMVDTTINSTLGIHPVEHPASSVSVFPNPTSGAFTIRANEQNPAMQICIYDVLGNCVLPKTSIKNNQQVDLSAQPKGIYFVEMTFGEERKTGKIILE